ncbi:MAG: site-specific recombinase [Chlorobiales bacterium]
MISFIKAKSAQTLYFEDFINAIPPAPHYDDGKWLIELVARLRPNKEETSDDAAKRLFHLIQMLKKSPETLDKFRAYFSFQIETRNHVRLFTEQGVIVHPSFIAEVIGRLGEKLLPPLYNPTELADFMDACFCERDDHIWVKAIPSTLWLELWQLLNYGGRLTAVGVFEISVLQSILVLSHRISAMGLEPDLMQRIPSIEHFASPFLVMDTEVGNYVEMYEKRLVKSREVTNDMLAAQYERAMNAIGEVMDCLEQVQENQRVQGVSLKLVYLLYRIRRALGRKKILMRLLSPFDRTNQAMMGVSLFKELVRAVNSSRDLKEHFSENTSLLAYKVAEHTSLTGEHYITSTRKEYWDFLVDAMGGGFIIAFTNWMKFLISYLNAAPLAGGLLYSLNYAGSFLLMHVFHFSLATKQPAMTASALARSLDSDDANEHNLENTADLVAKISRSQFAAFLGNLAVVLPLAFALSWIWYFISGNHIATEEKAFYTIASFNPLTTLSVFYAALTGVILYLGSFVSGYCDNFVMYGQLHARIRTHRFWRKFVSEKRLDKIGKYLEQNLGAIVGNLFLGFALGMTPIIGQITGLPLDVRHVTIAGGGSAIAFASIWDKLSVIDVATTLFGVFCVGLLNFLVSFSLSLTLAVSSRRVNFKESRALIATVVKRLRANPMSFLIPPKAAASSESQSVTPSVK